MEYGNQKRLICKTILTEISAAHALLKCSLVLIRTKGPFCWSKWLLYTNVFVFATKPKRELYSGFASMWTLIDNSFKGMNANYGSLKTNTTQERSIPTYDSNVTAEIVTEDKKGATEEAIASIRRCRNNRTSRYKDLNVSIKGLKLISKSLVKTSFVMNTFIERNLLKKLR